MKTLFLVRNLHSRRSRVCSSPRADCRIKGKSTKNNIDERWIIKPLLPRPQPLPPPPTPINVVFQISLCLRACSWTNSDSWSVMKSRWCFIIYATIATDANVLCWYQISELNFGNLIKTQLMYVYVCVCVCVCSYVCRVSRCGINFALAYPFVVKPELVLITMIIIIIIIILLPFLKKINNIV